MAEFKLAVIDDQNKTEVEIPGLSEYDKPEKISMPNVGAMSQEDVAVLDGGLKIKGKLILENVDGDPVGYGEVYVDENGFLKMSLG